jgi:hypothetical protein
VSGREQRAGGRGSCCWLEAGRWSPRKRNAHVVVSALGHGLDILIFHQQSAYPRNVAQRASVQLQCSADVARQTNGRPQRCRITTLAAIGEPAICQGCVPGRGALPCLAERAADAATVDAVVIGTSPAARWPGRRYVGSGIGAGAGLVTLLGALGEVAEGYVGQAGGAGGVSRSGARDAVADTFGVRAKDGRGFESSYDKLGGGQEERDQHRKPGRAISVARPAEDGRGNTPCPR